MEEDSTDRLWLVIRSLKNPEGKYVSFDQSNWDPASYVTYKDRV
jgi:hypothetical protein